jgi:hypothetical protein
MKRSLDLLVALLLALTMSAPALAQDATPEAAEPAPPFVTASGLGLSEFDVTVSDAGFDLPSSIPAGRYLVNVSIDTSEPAAASFFMPPADWTLEQVQAAFAPPEDDPEGEPNVAWLYDAPIAGGAMGAPGTTAQAVIDLSPGRWVVWADDPASAIPMTEVQVTGAMPDVLRPMTPTVTITATSTADGYGFAVTGDVVAGPQLVEFYNKTDQPHFVTTLVSPVPLDGDQFMQLLMLDEGATPAPDSGLPSLDEIQFSPSGITTVSAGVKIWAVVDFASGHNVIACYIPDLNSPEMVPHALEGMYAMIDVP